MLKAVESALRASNNVVSLNVTALPNIPLIQPGDDLVHIVLEGLAAGDLTLQTGDVLVITSKIVSKAEGRQVRLDTVEPSERAIELAAAADKDARIVELILRESVGISRQSRGVLVMEHRLGFISANAGIDQSNIEHHEDHVLLLPLDPDATAKTIHERLLAETGVAVGIVISDSHNRPFRLGTMGVAIGLAGIPAILDFRGKPDLFGREMRVSMQAYGDLIASVGQLIGGEGAEGRPITLIRGLQFPPESGTARDLLRPPEQDLYR